MIMVDSGKQDCEWGYTNLDGIVESVLLNPAGIREQVQIKTGIRDETPIYVDDIPKLVKALQSAYTYSQQEK